MKWKSIQSIPNHVLKAVCRDWFNTTIVKNKIVLPLCPILPVGKIRHRGIMWLGWSHTANWCWAWDHLSLAHRAIVSPVLIIYCSFHPSAWRPKQPHRSTPEWLRSWSTSSLCCYRYCFVNLLSLTLQGEGGSFHCYWSAPLWDDMLSSEENGKTRSRDSIILIPGLSVALGKDLHPRELQMQKETQNAHRSGVWKKPRCLVILNWKGFIKVHDF